MTVSDNPLLTGLTSNPTIFHRAISSGPSYDTQIRDAALRGLDVKAIYEEIAVRDIQAAADLLRPVYDQADAEDGFVSLEVSPELAYDISGSVDEGRRLWAAVDRPNLMIKIPATKAALPAVTALLAEGVNVNARYWFGQLLGGLRAKTEALRPGASA